MRTTKWMAVIGLVAWFLSLDSLAQGYPNKPVKLIVPFAPGGPADLMSRVVGKKLSEGLGQPIVVDSRGGGGGTIATESGAKSPADGYTLVLGSISTLVIGPSINSKLGYDPIKSFAPISMVAISPSLLVINPGVPANNLRELIDLAKKRPGQLNFGSNGSGTLTHLAAEYFKHLTGVNIVHVPYKGAAPATSDLIAGQIQMFFVVSYGLEQYIRTGKLRAIAVASSKRLPQLPEVPTTAEAGLPGFETYTWFGLVAPQGTPLPIIERLNGEMHATLAAKEVSDTLGAQGLESRASTPEQFAQFVAAEAARWAPVVKGAGLKID